MSASLFTSEAERLADVRTRALRASLHTAREIRVARRRRRRWFGSPELRWETFEITAAMFWRPAGHEFWFHRSVMPARLRNAIDTMLINGYDPWESG